MPEAERPITQADQLYRYHARRWQQSRYVYPVISRRSGGLSIGINLSLDMACNFDCVYCQVNRGQPAPPQRVDAAMLRQELIDIIDAAQHGELWTVPPFDRTPADLRKIRDMAFSGDGEPTAHPDFPEALQVAGEVNSQMRIGSVPLVIMTNGSLLHQPPVRKAIDQLRQSRGELWIKLDAGTPAYFQLIDRNRVKFEQIIANIRDAGRKHPVVIQSMFVRLNGNAPPASEFEAYCDRLAELVAAGCHIRLVQLYTVARQPAESYVSPLTERQLRGLLDYLHWRLPDLPCEMFGGSEDGAE